MFLRLPSASSLSDFSSLESRLSFTELSLVGPGLEAYLQVGSEVPQTPSGLVAKPDLQVSYSPNSLSTEQDTSIVIGPLHIFDVIRAEEARGVRFGLVAVVRCQRQAANMYDDHSDEISRVTQAEKGRVQFERCP